MLNSDNFLLRKNYFYASLLDLALRFCCFVMRAFGITPKIKGVKNRIIFVELGHLGDALLMTPAIRLAKRIRPELEIHCLASGSATKGLEGNNNISRIWNVAVPWYEKEKPGFYSMVKGFIHIVRTIREICPETIVNFRSTAYHVVHLAMFLAGISERAGYAHKGFAFVLTRQIPFRPDLNVIQQKTDIVGYLLTGRPPELKDVDLLPEFSPVGEISPYIFSFVNNFRQGALKIGINNSAQHDFLWPDDHIIRLCRLLYDKFRPEIIFLGTADFAPAAENIMTKLTIPTHSLVGSTSLVDLAFIICQLDLLVTIDTGMRHIANALGTPVVALRKGADAISDFGKYAATEDVLVATIPCAQCGQEICPLGGNPACMGEISPGQVFEAAIKKLSDNL